MSFQTIETTIENRILNITLCRPEKRNALNHLMVQELTSSLTENSKNEEIVGLVLKAKGKAFCAGADLEYLKDLQSKNFEDNLKDSQALKDLFLKLYYFPVPTVALVQGAAIAGGCGLMSVCDMVYAAEEAVFGYPEVKIGFVAALVSVFLLNLVGERQTRELLFTGKTISASEARLIGLISETTTTNDLDNRAGHFFKQIEDCSPEAMRFTKRMISMKLHPHLEEMLEEACHFNAESRQTGDFREGISAFLEKRSPVWHLNH